MGEKEKDGRGRDELENRRKKRKGKKSNRGIRKSWKEKKEATKGRR